jgi:hypothetical protein
MPPIERAAFSRLEAAMSASSPTVDAARDLVTRSRRAQNLPATVEDLSVLNAIATVLVDNEERP